MRLSFLYIIMIIFGAVFPARSQTVFQPKQSDFELKGFIYNEEVAGDLRIHTNGFTIGFNLGKIKTYYKTTYNHFSIGYINDPREKKQNKNISLPSVVPSSSFIYGKQNNLLILRAGKGVKRYWTDKAKRRGVSIGYHYEAGPALGFLKPYYLNILYIEDGGSPGYRIQEEKYSESNRETFLDDNAIYGGTGYFKGFNEMKIVPGIQAHAGILISMGAYEEYVRNLQIGVMADVFIKDMPIMIETENISSKPYFINLYLNFQFGKRTN